ncbi:hypothetical protein BRC90_06380 [Halobacteriales archaeon QS_4_69_34]|nr:MAG: hypothetical protein BRC90_06380 [Halobacteriales archaeon QS_4_69_34]
MLGLATVIGGGGDGDDGGAMAGMERTDSGDGGDGEGGETTGMDSGGEGTTKHDMGNVTHDTEIGSDGGSRARRPRRVAESRRVVRSRRRDLRPTRGVPPAIVAGWSSSRRAWRRVRPARDTVAAAASEADHRSGASTDRVRVARSDLASAPRSEFDAPNPRGEP